MLDLLVYLDELLIKNLNSVVLNGYIDIRTVKRVKDRTFGGSARISERNSKGLDFKDQRDKIEGYKSKHNSYAENLQDGRENSLGFEGRDFDRVEQEIKKISTVFTLHNDLVNRMYSSKNMKKISYKSIKNGNVKVGDYVEVTGCIQETSLPDYIDTVLNSINCYGIDFFNSILDKTQNKSLNFNIIYNLLNGIKNSITQNGSRDLIVKNEDISILLTINQNNFVNNGYNMFDFVQCSCKIFGKVMMIKEDKDKCVSLLRKSSQETYYQKILDSIEPYLDILRKNNIILPNKPECNIKGKMIMILPMSICI
ncbi:hypothetical protein [Clostridium tertium]|uniref:Uncharacterized protein n=1 Tax=Clostridium tertium TaxID=1559 RepID=A0A6N2YAY9_9CLOT